MITIHELEIAFNEFNDKFFNNKLPFVTIKYCNAQSYMGLFIPKKDKFNRFIIKINRYYDITDIDAKNILLHEMIHLWQFINNYSDFHGHSFKLKMKEINNHGYNVVIREKRNLIIKNNNIKSSYIFIWKNKFNKRKITRIENINNINRVKEHLLNDYSKYYNCVELHAYEIKHQKIELLRKGRKYITSYELTDDFWNEIKKSIIQEFKF